MAFDFLRGNQRKPAEQGQKRPWWQRAISTGAGMIGGMYGGPALGLIAQQGLNAIWDRTGQPRGLLNPSRTAPDGNIWGNAQDFRPSISPLSYQGQMGPTAGMTNEQLEAQSEARMNQIMQQRIEQARNGGQAVMPTQQAPQSNRGNINLHMDSRDGATLQAMLALAQQRAAGVGSGQIK